MHPPRLLLPRSSLHIRSLARYPITSVASRMFTAASQPQFLSSKTQKVLEVPRFDKNEYDQLVLPNGILATIVSDPTLQRSGAAMAVGVGASSDPISYPGLAHFTEHMLFLGTEKYPAENHYKQFLSKHGGSSNASTSMETTVYKFDVNHAHFEEALDIFSQFFRRPLLSPQCVHREIQAVDAEDSKNRQLDARRALQVIKSLMHPPIDTGKGSCRRDYAKYSTGNARTLRDHVVPPATTSGSDNSNSDGSVGSGPEQRVEEETAASQHTATAMRRFYAEHYPRAPMAVTLVGPQSLAQLRAMAVNGFQDIPRDDSTKSFFSPTPITSAVPSGSSAVDPPSLPLAPSPFMQTGVLVRLPPVKEMKEIALIWNVPPTRSLYRADPCRLLSHLLGHEGEGSAYAALQAKGWITGLSAGTRATFEDSLTLFQVSVSLTPLGVEHHQEVAATVYAHIRALRNMTEQQLSEYWRDLGVCDWLDFHYKQKGSSPRDFAAVISGKALATSDPHFLQHLQPSRAVTLLRHKGLADWIHTTDKATEDKFEEVRWRANAPPGEMANRLEKWYGVHFHVEAMSSADLQQLEEGTNADVAEKIHLPAPNKFIPYSLQLTEEEKDEVKGVAALARNEMATANSNCTHQLNLPVLVEKGRDNTMTTRGGGFETTPYSVQQNQLNRLTTKFYSRLHAVARYPADMAGLHHSVTWWKKGVQVTCSGFTPHLGELLMEVLSDPPTDGSKNLDDEEVLFDNVKEKHIRALRSWYKNRPDSQCADLLEFFLQEDTFLVDEQLAAAEAVTFTDLLAHMRRLPSIAVPPSIATVEEDVGSNAQARFGGSKMMYVHGHMSLENARALFAQVAPVMSEKGHNSHSSYEPSRATLLVESEMNFLFPSFNPDDQNSAIISHFQMGPEPVTPLMDATLLLLQRFLSEPMFTTLRTKEQLGYIVSISKQSFGEGKNRVGGLTVRILSKQYNPLFMKSKLDDFLETFPAQYLSSDSVSSEEFERRVQILTSLLTEPPQSYGQEAQAIWANIRDDLPQDYRQQVVAALQQVTLSSLREAFGRYIVHSGDKQSQHSPSQCCRISIMLCANAHREVANVALKASSATVCCQEDAFATLRAIKSVQTLTTKIL